MHQLPTHSIFKTECFSLAFYSTNSYEFGDFYAYSRYSTHHFLDFSINPIPFACNPWETEERDSNGNSQCGWNWNIPAPCAL